MECNGSRAICSICYEDLKPVVEDLQAVSVCGHVFHEICLQQWFEYCPSNRKQTCPVCKQSCSANKACRLYFQSTEEVTDATATQRLTDSSKDPEKLRREVLRLEGKVSGLNSTLDRQTNDLKELNDELFHYKELVKKEVALKDDAIKQKTAMQQQFHLKSQEFEKSRLECLKLHERNMVLAKELAALKLVSNLELGEDEALKLASLGNESNTKETIDILRKSLVIRNKSYKELMVKCNVLGRGEARNSIKLEKAQEKISKLKVSRLLIEGDDYLVGELSLM
ncbi:hypothetical protein SAY86_000952 [Trapa natans]|uniref:RING-type domain-containing protein n=1 Tax=Trapa natans TaxID=22666 RepID=A0AAN7MBT1_TRANT|nr:hypothetical protein SAY86_000952 [Trapa natans]